jgi:hypothetical protein
MADPASNTTYPGEIDLLPEIAPNTKENDVGQEHDVMHDKAHALLNALQAMLGTLEDPDVGTVLARLAAIEGAPSSSTVGRHAIYVSAAGMRPSATGGCAALANVASAANQPDIQTLDFDASTAEYAQFSLVMPKKWNKGSITFKPHWSHAPTTTNFGVVWSLQAVAVGNDDAIAANFGSAQSSADTGGTTNDLYTGPESSAITVAGSPGDEEMVFFRVARLPSDGGDTMAIDARLHGVTLYVTTAANTDT